jgi:hypothetical protein
MYAAPYALVESEIQSAAGGPQVYFSRLVCTRTGD